MKSKKNKAGYKMFDGLTGKGDFAAIVCFALSGILLQAFIQNGLFSKMHFVYIIHPIVMFLNVLPVFLVSLLVYFLSGRMWIGTAVTYTFVIVINIVNYFKNVFRGEILKISDLRLAGELGSIMQSYELKITSGIIVSVVLAAVLVRLAARCFKTRKIKWNIRIIGTAAVIFCMVLSYKFIYMNNLVLSKENGDVDMSKEYGFLYTFLANAETDDYGMPEGYSEKEAKKILEENQTSGKNRESTAEKINVIAIMGEAFFDVTRGGNAEFEEETDPYMNYHRLQEEGYYGKMTVPGFGGGTETTEFEFLTGASLYLLNESMPTAYKTYVTQPIYSLVRFFKDNGYAATAIHPGNSWFYDRNNAYERIGFDNFIACEDMDEDAPKICGYIEDSYTTEQILENYIEHYNKNPEEPYFNFTVTIQNHGAYSSVDEGRDKIYIRPDNMSDENYWIINNYLNGVRDTDRLLGNVCDFVSKRNEPIVVLFFGDHLPYLDSKIECFNALGYDISHRNEEGIENRYMVEYLFYGNETAKNIIEKLRGNVKTGYGTEISSGFLGAELLDYMGMEKSPYFEFVNNMEKKINVISPNYYKSGDVKFDILDDEKNDLIKRYKILQYYNLREYRD